MDAAFKRAKLMKKKNKKIKKRSRQEQAEGADDASGKRLRTAAHTTQEPLFTPALQHAAAAAADGPPARQLTAMAMMAQERGPDTVPVAELQRLRSLPSVANVSTSDDEQGGGSGSDGSGSDRAASVEP